MKNNSLQSAFIYGAGGFALEVATYLRRNLEATYQLESFLDDDPEKTECIGLRVYRPEEFMSPKNPVFFWGMGMPVAKKKAFNKIEHLNPVFPTLIDKKAEILDPASIKIGRGVLIAPGSICTTHIEIGDFAMLNLNVTVGHESKIGSYSSLMPGVHLSGNVHIGNEVMIGTGAVVLNGVRIGDGALIGAGAVVTRDVAAGDLVVGIPARPRS